MLIHSPSTPTTISVRFRFLIPLMLHTPVAWMRPFVEPTGLDSEAKVNGAPISLSDDIVSGRLVGCLEVCVGRWLRWFALQLWKNKSGSPLARLKIGRVWLWWLGPSTLRVARQARRVCIIHVASVEHDVHVTLHTSPLSGLNRLCCMIQPRSRLPNSPLRTMLR